MDNYEKQQLKTILLELLSAIENTRDVSVENIESIARKIKQLFDDIK